MINQKKLLEKIIISAYQRSQKGKLREFEFGQIKRFIIKNEGVKKLPPNTMLLPVYHKLVKSRKIKASPFLEAILQKKKMRTLSGIASITVITPDFGCPGKCIYCPTEKGMPKSYLSNEPAVMRAIANKFNPYNQVKTRLDALNLQGHKTSKIELIIAGGTWSYIPESYQIWFIANCYAAANKSNSIKKSSSLAKLSAHLKKEQKKNEKTSSRIVGLTLETRPDWINGDEIKKMRNYGCTRVELGVQSIYNDVLKKCARGHEIKETIEATKLLKNAGFKINYHIMLGLPGSSPARDQKMIETLFVNPDFQPDMLKIYPCVVLKDTGLYRLWKNKKFKPYSDKKIINILKEAKVKVPEYCRIVRVIRDIPTPSIIDGGKISNLRELILQNMHKEGKKCRCIRCREIKDSKFKAHNLKLKRTDYDASCGREVFLSFEDVKNDKLVALLRLRIPNHDGQGVSHKKTLDFPSDKICAQFRPRSSPLRSDTMPARPQMFFLETPLARCSFSTLQNSALIREVHTYGPMEKINQKGKTQHLGLGKKLIKEAEKIAKKEFKLNKIAVISGIGVRNYYRKFGYKLKDTYLVKNI